MHDPAALKTETNRRGIVHALVERFERSLGADVAMHPAELSELEWMARCSTGELGIVRVACPQSGPGHYVNEYAAPCKKRLCTRCVGSLIGRFLQAFLRLMLPCPVHQVVVTLWSVLRDVWDCNRTLVTQLMFDAAVGALTELLSDPRYLGATVGIVGVLHTAGAGLLLHPHIHFVVTAGGLDREGIWRRTKPGWLIPKKVFRKLFRGRFISALSAAQKSGLLFLPRAMTAGAFHALLGNLRHRKWNVHIGTARKDPKPLILYVASRLYGGPVRDHQIVHVDDRNVTFYTERSERTLTRWIERGIRPATQTLPLAAFVRGILKHWLPKQTRAVRYFGLYAPTLRPALERARVALGLAPHDTHDAPPIASCSCGLPLEVRRSRPTGWPKRRCIHASDIPTSVTARASPA